MNRHLQRACLYLLWCCAAIGCSSQVADLSPTRGNSERDSGQSSETEPPPVFSYGPSTCGDGETEGVELCDGRDLQGLTCEDFGFKRGTLTCSSYCTGFVVANCEGVDVEEQDEGDPECTPNLLEPTGPVTREWNIETEAVEGRVSFDRPSARTPGGNLHFLDPDTEEVITFRLRDPEGGRFRDTLFRTDYRVYFEPGARSGLTDMLYPLGELSPPFDGQKTRWTLPGPYRLRGSVSVTGGGALPPPGEEETIDMFLRPAYSSTIGHRRARPFIRRRKQGRFSLEGNIWHPSRFDLKLLGGQYRLGFNSPSVLGRWLETSRGRIEEVDKRRGLLLTSDTSLDVAIEREILAGSVTIDGKPLGENREATVEIRATGAPVRDADDTHRFSLGGEAPSAFELPLPPGRYELDVRLDSGFHRSVNVSTSRRSPITIDVEHHAISGVIHGLPEYNEVSRERDGETRSFSQLRFVRVDPATGSTLGVVRLDLEPTGKMTYLRRVPPGTYDIISDFAMTPDGGIDHQFRLESGVKIDGDRELDLTIPWIQTHTVRGRVTVNGAPIPHVELRTANMGDVYFECVGECSGAERFRADVERIEVEGVDKGFYYETDVAPGMYRILAEIDDYRQIVVPRIDIRDDRRIDGDIRAHSATAAVSLHGDYMFDAREKDAEFEIADLDFEQSNDRLFPVETNIDGRTATVRFRTFPGRESVSVELRARHPRATLGTMSVEKTFIARDDREIPLEFRPIQIDAQLTLNGEPWPAQSPAAKLHIVSNRDAFHRYESDFYPDPETDEEGRVRLTFISRHPRIEFELLRESRALKIPGERRFLLRRACK